MASTRSKQDQFQLRLPPGLRDQIKTAADASGRSMNSEIIARLEKRETLEFAAAKASLATQIELNAALQHNFQMLAEWVANRLDKEEALAALSNLRANGLKVPK
jgi:hypothetical protein